MAYKRQKQYRLPGHTYAEPDAYYITICTKDRQQAFGEVIRIEGIASVVLSEIGQVLSDEINKLESRYSNLILGKWQIMPDHVHLVLHLHDGASASPENASRNNAPQQHEPQQNAPRRVPTCPVGIQPLNPGSVSSIANHLKGTITKWAKANCCEFYWQPRFNDHIVRDKTDLGRIEHYIVNNPESWLRDRSSLSYLSPNT